MRYACHEGAGDLQAAENAPSENNSIHHLVRSYVSKGLAAILDPRSPIGSQITDLKGPDWGGISHSRQGLARATPDRNPVLRQAKPGYRIDFGVEKRVKTEWNPHAQCWFPAKLLLYNVKAVAGQPTLGLHGCIG
jgi:hypothetical protein